MSEFARVLAIPAFRRLWIALSLSSFGDWLGLLALTALATRFAEGDFSQANLAVAAVFILRLAPAILLGPVAGAVADRLDRRWTMVVCDVLRFGLFVSIPLVGTLEWLLAATFLIECAAMFWIPAKEAAVPGIVPRGRLQAANQLSLFTTYGSAPVAAAVFALLTVVGGPLSRIDVDAVDVALILNGVTFLVSAVVIATLTRISGTGKDAAARQQGMRRTIAEGWSFIGKTPLVRGLVVGILGAFAAGGAVIALARTHVTDLGAGDPGYGILFAAVFIGLAGGMAFGPRLLGGFSRRRFFGLSIVAAGLSLIVLALLPDLVLTALVTLVLGAFTGAGWITGYTMLGLEVSDEMRGRTFAFVQTMARVVLIAVLALAPLLAAAVGRRDLDVGGLTVSYNGTAIVWVVSGLLAIALGATSYRQMDDRRGIPLLRDLAGSLRRAPAGERRRDGFLLAFEGGEGAGKSTQTRLVVEWLRQQGHEVVPTREPGGTEVGRRLRQLLLDPATQGLSARAEALLYAADRAQHVAAVIRPGLARGGIVVTDRYLDSSVAYQGAGRELPAEEIARLSKWATGDLLPDLTVILDLPPDIGLTRSGATPDRLEAEPLAFHERVRAGFLRLAAAHPSRYLVVDAGAPPAQVQEAVRARLGPLLPLSAAQRAAEEEQQRLEQVRAEEERERAAEARRRAEVARQEEVGEKRARAAALRQRKRLPHAGPAPSEAAGGSVGGATAAVGTRAAGTAPSGTAAADRAAPDGAAADRAAPDRAAADSSAAAARTSSARGTARAVGRTDQFPGHPADPAGRDAPADKAAGSDQADARTQAVPADEHVGGDGKAAGGDETAVGGRVANAETAATGGQEAAATRAAADEAARAEKHAAAERAALAFAAAQKRRFEAKQAAEARAREVLAQKQRKQEEQRQREEQAQRKREERVREREERARQREEQRRLSQERQQQRQREREQQRAVQQEEKAKADRARREREVAAARARAERDARLVAEQQARQRSVPPAAPPVTPPAATEESGEIDLTEEIFSLGTLDTTTELRPVDEPPPPRGQR